MDATLVSPLHADGTHWASADTNNGVAIKRAEADKRDTYWDLVDSPHLHLMTLACEVGGRWSEACRTTIRGLAQAKSREAPNHARKAARIAWESRWWAILSVAQQDTLAATLVDDAVPLLGGHDGEEPTLPDVIYDAGLAPEVSRVA